MNPSLKRWLILLGWAGILLAPLLAGTILLGMMESNYCKPLQWVCKLFGVQEKSAVVGRFIEFAAGWILIAGLLVAYQRSQALADTAKAHLQAVEVTNAGQQQERFRDAVSHLAHENASIRQGGAHVLFHLALENDAFRVPIAEILCAHLREITQDKEYQAKRKEPTPEVQSLLTLLFVEGADGILKTFWKGIRPNLMNCNFQGATRLNGAQFQNARLEGVKFSQGAQLNHAQFQGAQLNDAQFQGSWLDGAQFQQAELGKAQFQGACADGAQFQGAGLKNAQFQGARLPTAQFQGTHLVGTQFQGAKLEDTQFQWAELEDAQFQGARLTGAQFQGAVLIRVQFQCARLDGAQFQGARFIAVQFQGALIELWTAEKKMESSLENRVSLVKLRDKFFYHMNPDFYEAKIRERIGREADLGSVVFSGGLYDAQVEEWVTEMKKYISIGVYGFEEEIKKHVEKPRCYTPPKDAEIDTGTYSKEEAEQWIQEYRSVLVAAAYP